MRASESSARDNRVEAHPEKPRGRTCHHLCTLIVVTHDVYLSLGRHGMHIPSESFEADQVRGLFVFPDCP